ncbi:hypothetical protein [Sphingomonas rubra]|uniref:DUF4268 domain-containing protein n=1 Tax=Sphingomonas rubra TaxID=634430 RepID=A0A1I5TNQ6_9SPHN|nr:hypothetical protein [Sphingomonas rubra]SFP84237.1 hypothetical protein SAMN04488241_108150 [Sphingomonas rubra]
MTLVLLDNDTTQVVRRVPQGEARREAVLRDLIAEHPALLPVHDLDPSYGRLVTVTRELSIPGVGFVDVLLMDEAGRLVMVECKLWRNPQARREVVGQILDYARELSRYGYEDLQRQVSIATRRQGNVLYALAQEVGGTLPEAEFVDRVTRDLAAGRFLLLVVGDGIAEGTRRIGEYLRDQPGLAFGFGLIEIAEYRHTDAGGTEHVIMQPRVLAQTAIIERHVIRSEVPGIVFDAVDSAAAARPTGGATTSTASNTAPRAVTETGTRWRSFVERFATDTRFDDPGQPPPKNGGNGWIRVPLPDGLYINVWRSMNTGRMGTQVRFAGPEQRAAFEALLAEREIIDAEFTAQDLEPPSWEDGEVAQINLSMPAPQPWTDEVEAEQRRWLGARANQLVNSLRPRLQSNGREMAA